MILGRWYTLPHHHQTPGNTRVCTFCVCWATTTIKMFPLASQRLKQLPRSCFPKSPKISVKLRWTSSHPPVCRLLSGCRFSPMIPVIPKQLHFQEKKCNKQSKFIKQGTECISAIFRFMADPRIRTLSSREIICDLHYDDSNKCCKTPCHSWRCLLNSLKCSKKYYIEHQHMHSRTSTHAQLCKACCPQVYDHETRGLRLEVDRRI